MIVKELPQEFLDAKPIIETIKQAGFEAYFVGGSVRDTLLGLPIHDVDIATSAYPREIKKIFKVLFIKNSPFNSTTILLVIDTIENYIDYFI